ncbi:phosphonate transport system substrate-binding protein [Microbulbifer donghaiensis]|uniref:Phosphonate transport system substrate-binding protein n=1 Tax=Microbulbifer donghaiensis TaxID=494016 RepID=A0A1M5G3L6_9GAMM|nr:phosphonate ABC transporter substrate-binding protein [Microbulbifer donghaiensis]SHF98309.1 phosphonate transport system substrate-binding protein [Microbulbifer donghaiensis]
MPAIVSLIRSALLLAFALLSVSAHALDSLRIALIPAEDSRAMVNQSQQLLEALEQKLGVEVQGFVAMDYNGVIEALRAGHVDVAYLGPFSYVKAAEIADVEAFAVAETKAMDGESYRSQIIVRADSEHRTIGDLKGKNFAFVDPTSTSGYLLPMLALKKAGIPPRRHFKNVIYTGGHDANILAVKHAKVDGATVADRILRSAIEKGMVNAGDFRVIWSSDAIPESPMVWRKALPQETKERIKNAFLSIHDIEFGDQGQLVGYKLTNDAAYHVVREAAKLARQ